MAPDPNSHDQPLTDIVEGETDAGPRVGGRRAPERRCIATAEHAPPERMVRFVRGPSGEAAPDIAGRLPGRGAWVMASRAAVDQAVKRQAFSRAFKAPTSTATDLCDQVERLLARRALDQLGLVRKSGDLVLGFDSVDAEIRSGRPGYLLTASDAAADGQGKLHSLLHGVHGESAAEKALPALFSADELGMALGRGRVVHAWLKQGRFAHVWIGDIARLAGFRQVRPSGAGRASADRGEDKTDWTAQGQRRDDAPGAGRPEDS